MSQKWTPADAGHALAQGWCVIDRNASGVLQIQRDDEADTFKFDDDALEHVLRNAHRDATCRRAITAVYGI